MAWQNILNIIGVISLLGYGIGSLLIPHRVGKLIAQQLSSPREIAEFRIVNGGYFIGLAAFALIIQHPSVYMVLGIGWLGAALARLFAFVIDRPKFDAIYTGLLIFEVAMALCLMA